MLTCHVGGAGFYARSSLPRHRLVTFSTIPCKYHMLLISCCQRNLTLFARQNLLRFTTLYIILHKTTKMYSIFTLLKSQLKFSFIIKWSSSMKCCIQYFFQGEVDRFKLFLINNTDVWIQSECSTIAG